ncbi:hypothetical protein DH2020_036127 [Rehmannia glutinosa]|uniref:Uncharacterized protein n=1 Tax=Rehmannia glutinosa TaxID=99300 RepID=A0ABR0V701_REHGL
MARMFFLTAIFMFSFHFAFANSSLQTYIVHVKIPQGGVNSGQSEELETWYNSFLPEATSSDTNNRRRMVHTYRNVITGFAAKLSQDEVKEMEKNDGFLYATPQKTYTLHTTHSPNFLGLYQNLGSWQGANYGAGVIIGVLDSGITPGHPSFSDEGMPPPPAKWKGKCELNGTVCNNKLIGARNFVTEVPGPPVDDFATARTRLARPWEISLRAPTCCFDSDILAAMDAAIEDGVDILSLSLGGVSVPFYNDSIAIGAFSAMERGIFVSCSAGNGGPGNSSLSNEAPWILTVGASTIDRKIRATAMLGNQESYDGESLYQLTGSLPGLLPLVYAGTSAGRVAKGQTVRDAGGAAMILMNDEASGYTTLADPHVLHATHVSYDAGLKIKNYINSSSTPTAAISFGGTVIGDKTAPAVASFSSRGPNFASPGILKPDIIGPGASILAAWPVSVDNYTNEKATFNMISGTSMSCPHLSGVAALIKSVHPDWSPAMIKSAIMTSATQINLNNSRILDQRYLSADIFAIGAGHVNPSMALDPGLVYDISSDDYISYLCYLYTEQQVAAIVHREISCHGPEYTGVPEAQLNYPSFAVVLGSTNYIYSRTVTNVGDAESTYSVQIESVPGVNVTVQPTLLSFNEVNQQMTYKIYFSREEYTTNGSYVQGSISWISAKHIVRIPVSVKLVL